MTTFLWSPTYLLLLTLGPFILFAVIVHLLEKLIERRLARRFGWKSVLWTGWLGVPVHELSHAFFCFVFGHEIKEIALFRPDRESKRLGFVLHSYRRGNRWQEIGNVFIGVAPLIGGTAALCLLLFLFYPSAAEGWWRGGETTGTAAAAGNALTLWELLSGSVRQAVERIFQVENLATVNFWVFVYLVTCIGCHMAPSFDDYRGSLKGALWAALILVAGSIAISWLVKDSAGFALTVHGTFVSVHIMLVLALLLCGVATLAVFVLTEITDWLGFKKQR